MSFPKTTGELVIIYKMVEAITRTIEDKLSALEEKLQMIKDPKDINELNKFIREIFDKIMELKEIKSEKFDDYGREDALACLTKIRKNASFVTDVDELGAEDYIEIIYSQLNLIAEYYNNKMLMVSLDFIFSRYQELIETNYNNLTLYLNIVAKSTQAIQQLNAKEVAKFKEFSENLSDDALFQIGDTLGENLYAIAYYTYQHTHFLELWRTKYEGNEAFSYFLRVIEAVRSATNAKNKVHVRKTNQPIFAGDTRKHQEQKAGRSSLTKNMSALDDILENLNLLRNIIDKSLILQNLNQIYEAISTINLLIKRIKVVRNKVFGQSNLKNAINDLIDECKKNDIQTPKINDYVEIVTQLHALDLTGFYRKIIDLTEQALSIAKVQVDVNQKKDIENKIEELSNLITAINLLIEEMTIQNSQENQELLRTAYDIYNNINELLQQTDALIANTSLFNLLLEIGTHEEVLKFDILRPESKLLINLGATLRKANLAKQACIEKPAFAIYIKNQSTSKHINTMLPTKNNPCMIFSPSKSDWVATITKCKNLVTSLMRNWDDFAMAWLALKIDIETLDLSENQKEKLIDFLEEYFFDPDASYVREFTFSPEECQSLINQKIITAEEAQAFEICIVLNKIMNKFKDITLPTDMVIKSDYHEL